MPEYRDWFIDRRSLEARGNMTVEAVQLIQSVTCRAWKPEKPSRKDRHLWFKTKMADNRKRKDEHNHDNKVKIQRRPRLAVWAHDYSFLSPTRTKTMLVFAALNGSIDGSVTTTDLPTISKVVNMSTIICDVDVEIVNNQLKVGNGGDSATAPVQITSLSHLRVTGGSNSTQDDVRFGTNKEDTLNELALWFTVAPIVNGASIGGAQPMYDHLTRSKDDLPGRATSGNSGSNSYWTIEYIENFIRISMGASAIADSTNLPDGEVTFNSLAYTLKLDPSRTMLLVIPPAIIIANAILLLVWNLLLHHQLQIPIMRKATIGEILKSAQTEDVRRRAMRNMQIPNQISQLDDLRVQFGATEAGLWGLSEPEGDSRLLVHELKHYRGDSY
jgi:hypothetical protein